MLPSLHSALLSAALRCSVLNSLGCAGLDESVTYHFSGLMHQITEILSAHHEVSGSQKIIEEHIIKHNSMLRSQTGLSYQTYDKNVSGRCVQNQRGAMVDGTGLAQGVSENS